MPVYVNLNGVDQAFKRADKLLAKEFRNYLKDAVKPVTVSGKAKIGAFHGAKVGRIRPVVTRHGVVVRQSQGKKTGKRPDFGGTQQRKLNEALDENVPEVIDGMEVAVMKIERRAGLH